jgi:hypothetical protein
MKSMAETLHPSDRRRAAPGVIFAAPDENDSFWGDGGDGSGRNMLGRIVMRFVLDFAAPANMTPAELEQRLRLWPSSPEKELRALPPDAQFTMLWPLAVASQTHRPAFPAAALLYRLNPKCPMTCSDAVASLLPHWDISIEEVPWHLVRQFGRASVIAAADDLTSRCAPGLERTLLSTVVYWAGLAKDAG